MSGCMAATAVCGVWQAMAACRVWQLWRHAGAGCLTAGAVARDPATKTRGWKLCHHSYMQPAAWCGLQVGGSVKGDVHSP